MPTSSYMLAEQLLPRDQAKVSVFDSSVQGGDAVWEGLRVYKNGIFCLDRHLDRLEASAHALGIYRYPFERLKSKKQSSRPSKPTVCATKRIYD